MKHDFWGKSLWVSPANYTSTDFLWLIITTDKHAMMKNIRKLTKIVKFQVHMGAMEVKINVVG